MWNPNVARLMGVALAVALIPTPAWNETPDLAVDSTVSYFPIATGAPTIPERYRVTSIEQLMPGARYYVEHGIQIEKGDRELTIGEAGKLVRLFGVSLEEFFAGEQPRQVNVKLISGKKKLRKKTDMRVSVPEKNVKKFKEVLLYVLEKVGNKPNVGMTVLYKLLYFIDFDFYLVEY